MICNGVSIHDFIAAYHAEEKKRINLQAYKSSPEGYMLAVEFIRANLAYGYDAPKFMDK